MAAKHQCELYVIRWMPDVLKGEFVNAGVMLLEPQSGFADVRFTRDYRRLRCLDPNVEPEYFEALEAEIRSRISDPDSREIFFAKVPDWASTSLQLSPLTPVLTDDPAQEIATLAEMYLENTRRATRERSGRAIVLNAMRNSFEQAGVWAHMRKRIAASQYAPGDPLRLDCGYRPNGVIKMFHAVSLATDVDAAKVLAFSYPQVREGIARIENAKSELTAIVEDELDHSDDAIRFALATFARTDIHVASVSDLAAVADTARRELRL